MNVIQSNIILKEKRNFKSHHVVLVFETLIKTWVLADSGHTGYGLALLHEEQQK